MSSSAPPRPTHDRQDAAALELGGRGLLVQRLLPGTGRQGNAAEEPKYLHFVYRLVLKISLLF